MPDGATIRLATANDVEAIARVGRETWPRTYEFAGAAYIEHGLRTWWSEAAIVRGLATTKTYVAEFDGRVISMGNIDLRPQTPVIWKLYVLPSHHGAGVGSALLDALLAEAAGSDVLLEYIDGNVAAERFYRRSGFVEVRREPAETPGWPERVWMMHGGHRPIDDS